MVIIVYNTRFYWKWT